MHNKLFSNCIYRAYARQQSHDTNKYKSRLLRPGFVGSRLVSLSRFAQRTELFFCLKAVKNLISQSQERAWQTSQGSAQAKPLRALLRRIALTAPRLARLSNNRQREAVCFDPVC